jgi:hypothetical protein
MDDETPEMEKLTQELRAAMAAWVAEPSNAQLKRRYKALQQQYQRLFLVFKRGQTNGVATG